MAESTFLDLYENFCDKMIDYKVHMDKKGLPRFQLEQSQLLKNLQKMSKAGTEVVTFLIRGFAFCIKFQCFVSEIILYHIFHEH